MRSWCPAVLVKPWYRRQDHAAINYAPDKQGSLSGYLFGHAGRRSLNTRVMCCGLSKAHSSEFNPKTPDPVIALISEWLDRDPVPLNNAMRILIWAAPCDWVHKPANCVEGTLAREGAYGTEGNNQRTSPSPLRVQQSLSAIS